MSHWHAKYPNSVGEYEVTFASSCYETTKLVEKFCQKVLDGIVTTDQKALTNADVIRAMSDEQLARLLLDGCIGSKCEDQPQNEYGSVNCVQCRLNWLKQLCNKEEE